MDLVMDFLSGLGLGFELPFGLDLDPDFDPIPLHFTPTPTQIPIQTPVSIIQSPSRSSHTRLLHSMSPPTVGPFFVLYFFYSTASSHGADTEPCRATESQRKRDAYRVESGEAESQEQRERATEAI